MRLEQLETIKEIMLQQGGQLETLRNMYDEVMQSTDDDYYDSDVWFELEIAMSNLLSCMNHTSRAIDMSEGLL